MLETDWSLLSDESAQVATEYLLLLAAAVTVVASVAVLVTETFSSLGSSVEDQISETENMLIEELT